MTWINDYIDDETAYEAKIYLRPSPRGINGGRISKLLVYHRHGDDWQVQYEYDRGGIVGKIKSSLLNRIVSIYDDADDKPEEETA